MKQDRTLSDLEADALFRQEKLSTIKRKDKFFHLTSFG